MPFGKNFASHTDVSEISAKLALKHGPVSILYVIQHEDIIVKSLTLGIICVRIYVIRPRALLWSFTFNYFIVGRPLRQSSLVFDANKAISR